MMRQMQTKKMVVFLQVEGKSANVSVTESLVQISSTFLIYLQLPEQVECVRNKSSISFQCYVYRCEIQTFSLVICMCLYHHQ